jgi:hypothetical protein
MALASAAEAATTTTAAAKTKNFGDIFFTLTIKTTKLD